jgi:DNA-binding XRE family transcriptional regulator
MTTISKVRPVGMRRGRPDGRHLGTFLECSMRVMRRLFNPPLTLEDVARHVGVSVPTLSRIERGADVSLELALRLAQFYEKPVEEIWTVREKRG